jgi:hypothetical protein
MAHARKWSPVVVLWEDAETHSDPINSEEFIATYKPLMRKTIGFLLHRDKERIFVAMDSDRSRAMADGGNDCQTTTVIPAAMIHEVKYLA